MEHTSSILYQGALIILIVSVLAKIAWQKKWVVYVLLLGGFLLALSAIYRDSYLHPWDERYHALVAKNAMETPLEPKLYKDTVIQDFNYKDWYKAHIWLHKQPMFIWQMAATMQIFGDGLVGMRLNSAIMLLLFSFAVYKATNLYFPRSSFWAALLAAVQPYLLLLASGRFGMDHNDLTFITWVAVGFWGLVAHLKKPDLKWILLIGASAGFAMLTKWLAGSFVLCVWGLNLLVSKDFKPKSWLSILQAGAVAAMIFVPWQLYCNWKFPEQFLKEWEYNSLHFTQVIERHQYPWFFHLQVWYENFALVGSLFVLGVVFVFKRTNHFKLMLSLILSVLAVLVFYSLAQTKLPSYTLFLLPVVLFIGASFFEKINLRFLRVLLTLLLVWFSYQEFRNLYLYNTQNEEYAEHQREIKKLSQHLVEKYPENTVIFNVPPMEFVEFMFYTDRLAYEFIPRKEQVEKLQKEGYQTVVLMAPGTLLNPNLKGIVEVEEVQLLK